LRINQIQNAFIVNATTEGVASYSLSANAICGKASCTTQAAIAGMSKPNARSNADGEEAQLLRISFY
jgi:hypothetical protein